MKTIFGRFMLVWALALASFGATPVAAQNTTLTSELANRGVTAGIAAIRSYPRILIAACNASARVKAKADFVSDCSGNDAPMIQGVIDSNVTCPVLPTFVRSATSVVGAKSCYLEFSEGQFNIATKITYPAGFVGGTSGQGSSSWRPIDPAPTAWVGGTFFYSTDPTGGIFALPQYTGTRTDTGTTNTIPASSIIFENIYATAFNPATTQGTFAFDFSGMTTGIVRNVNAFADLSVNATSRIQGGFSFAAGSRSDRKIVEGLSAAYFRDVGFNINTTHFNGRMLVAAAITGGTSPAGFQITPAQDMQLEGLHPFSTGIGVKIGGDEPLHIGSIMFESLSNPILLQTSTNLAISIGTATLNSDVSWTGDITNKIRVERFGGTKAGTGATTKRIRNGGTVTLTAGQTSVVIPHQLIAAPLSYRASILGGGGVTTTTTADATNLTVTIPTAQGADITIQWGATATINEVASLHARHRAPANDNESLELAA